MRARRTASPATAAAAVGGRRAIGLSDAMRRRLDRSSPAARRAAPAAARARGVTAAAWTDGRATARGARSRSAARRFCRLGRQSRNRQTEGAVAARVAAPPPPHTPAWRLNAMSRLQLARQGCEIDRQPRRRDALKSRPAASCFLGLPVELTATHTPVPLPPSSSSSTLPTRAGSASASRRPPTPSPSPARARAPSTRSASPAGSCTRPARPRRRRAASATARCPTGRRC